MSCNSYIQILQSMCICLCYTVVNTMIAVLCMQCELIMTWLVNSWVVGVCRREWKVVDCAGIIPLVYIELVASALMFILGIVLLIGINYVSSRQLHVSAETHSSCSVGCMIVYRGKTNSINFVTQLCCSIKLPRQLSVFSWQTIAKQTWLLVTQTTIQLWVVLC